MRLAILSGLVLACVAKGGDPKAPSGKHHALVTAHEKAQRDFSAAYQAARTDADREKASKELGTRSMPDAHAGAFLALMKEHPKDPVALDVTRWLVSRAGYSTEADRAVDAALRDWID